MTTTPVPIGDRYRAIRERITELVSSIDEAAWATPVSTCPGWNVHDVLAHLVGVIEDAAAGIISGPPSSEQTAIEVERHRGDDPSALLSLWSSLSPPFEEVITAVQIGPAFFDVLTHEYDIRGALGSPIDRDNVDVRMAAEMLAERLPSTMKVSFGTPDESGEAPEGLCLTTDHFEFFRLRLGRRSRAQVAGLNWSSDPEAVLDRLFIFGPATEDVIE